ncbi:MAG: Minf_1886 family protein, partial [Planctomycetota bacterium]
DHDFENDDQPSRHVTGRILCEGLRDFALQQYGLLAGTVLRRWRVTRCEDFGRIVFAMVEAGMMHKTDEDSLEDFEGLFSFREAFGKSSLALN